jgi:threonine dehydrogenase-like Zn-dependent dehydrogenase
MVFPVVYGVVRGRHDFEIAADILRTPGLPFGEIISHRFPLEEVREAYAMASTKSRGVIRVVVGRTEEDLGPDETVDTL